MPSSLIEKANLALNCYQFGERLRIIAFLRKVS
jgi:hypothetical protein